MSVGFFPAGAELGSKIPIEKEKFVKNYRPPPPKKHCLVFFIIVNFFAEML